MAWVGDLAIDDHMFRAMNAYPPQGNLLGPCLKRISSSSSTYALSLVSPGRLSLAPISLWAAAHLRLIDMGTGSTWQRRGALPVLVTAPALPRASWP